MEQKSLLIVLSIVFLILFAFYFLMAYKTCEEVSATKTGQVISKMVQKDGKAYYCQNLLYKIAMLLNSGLY